MDNPLLNGQDLPAFSEIKPGHVLPAIEQLIARNESVLDEVVASNRDTISWKSLVLPLEESGDALSKAWSPVGHLNAVMNNEALRTVYSEARSRLTDYYTRLGHRRDLYDAYLKLYNSDEFQSLDQARQSAVEQELRDFRLSGVALDEDSKQRFAAIQQRLSELSNQISNQVLDATQGWYRHITDEAELAGIPSSSVALARGAAEARDLDGYVFTLDLPSYLAVMTHADSGQLRREMYDAYVTRASEVGPNAGQWDNTALIEETLRLRHEAASLLGFENYAERSLATKMAESSEQVEGFLLDLASKCRKAAESELDQLALFARQQGLTDMLSAWDIAYYSEKLKQAQFSVSQEELRPYFPVDRVLNGLFELASRLFGLEIRETQVDVWHQDVSYYEILKDGSVIAGFYLDLFARDNKRGGAWMDECRCRRVTAAGTIQLPVAYLVCNFTPPMADAPSLLTHNEVTTLFHEFGHGLHHMLTRIDTGAVSGIRGVAWDAVELPSQFLENWCWEKSVIPLISAHYQTGDALPQAMLDNLLAAKNFQSAMQMLRQIEFALFDLRLHRDYSPDAPLPVQQVLDAVRKEVAVLVPPEYNRFQNSFTHIFAGGYAAGYYSYKWAEVLSADAFSRFEEEGVLNQETGADFRSSILEQGGSREAMDLFIQFRGREPSSEALLRHSGISLEDAA